MAINTKCQTPGAIFKTHITSQAISVTIDLLNARIRKEALKLNKRDAILLEKNLHNAIELVLAPFFVIPKK